MNNPLWAKSMAECADPLRARHYHKLFCVALGEQVGGLTPGQIKVLVALFSGSQALSDWLVAHPDCLAELDLEHIAHPRRLQGFKRQVDKLLEPALARQDHAQALAQLRGFKQREMVRIAARDLCRVANAIEITRELSDVADVCLRSVWRICWTQFTSRFGRPYHPDPDGRWQETAACVVGLGKLGGQELNYSSDVDVIFVYADEGQVFREPPGAKPNTNRVMSNHVFFNRLAENFIAEVTRMAPEGTLYRMDLRLRPEGDAGPLCRSLESYENFYAQWGQTWERMMLIKARCVAGEEILGHEFTEMIQPFRYPRSLNERVLREVAAMKGRIEVEVVKSGELDRNVKLGRGGIREIEFVAQSLQLLHAGRLPFLQTAQTLPCLAKLAQYGLLTGAEAHELEQAYCFLRDVEHRCQMEANLQTHTIPAERLARERLAKLMGFASFRRFEQQLRTHTRKVRRTYDRLMQAEVAEAAAPFPREFELSQAEWKEVLAAHRFRDPDAAFRVLKEFAEGPGYVHVSAHTTALAHQLIPKILALCPQRQGGESASRPVLSDPDRVLTRLDSFISAYGARAALFELWNSRPAMFEMLLLLFDRSEFLAELAIRTPDLIDDLVVGERLRLRKSAEEILRDLKHGLRDADQFLWLRRYHETEQMRLGLRDILGLADYEQNMTELSALADACLRYALAVVMQEQRLKREPFAIIGLGKLGGGEITYGSDLDVVFVTETKAKDLPKLQKLAARVMDLMSRRTEQGMVFLTDARLRPDGEKGLLVNTLAAYERYYRQRAQLWEIQSLTRVRAVAGDAEVGNHFRRLAAQLTDLSARAASARASPKSESRRTKGKVFPVGRPAAMACWTADWKMKIHEMRLRIEKERTPKGQDELAIKTGKGGLMDAEFIAQTLCLEHGWQEPQTLRALERGREVGRLPDAEKLLVNYRQLRRLESILRRWSYEGETVLPDDPAPHYRVSVRCGFASSDEFRTALAGWRKAIREVYLQFFCPA